MVNKVRKRLDSYLGFDSDELFACGDPLVFGGALRDSIADMHIHDIDIVGGGNSITELHKLLISKKYTLHKGLVDKHLSEVYTGLNRVISEPMTYINEGGSVVQLIRPAPHPHLMRKHSLSSRGTSISSSVVDYNETCRALAEEVDLSCCGLTYNGTEIEESYPNSILHCQEKVFIVNEGALMKTSRLSIRKEKLMRRGWREITKVEERDLIIDICIR